MKTTRKPKILLLFKKTILLEGITNYLHTLGSYDYSIANPNSKLIIEKLKAKKYDLIIMEFSHQCIDNVELAVQMRKTCKNPLLIFTKHNDHLCYKKAVRLKMDGYITLEDKLSDLNDAITHLLKGETYFKTNFKIQSNTEIPKIKISKREAEIITYLLKGYQSKNIGEILEISHRTVGKHRENIMRKCKVNSVTELIYFCQKNEQLIPLLYA